MVNTMHREFPDILLATVSKSFAGFVPEEGSQIWQNILPYTSNNRA